MNLNITNIKSRLKTLAEGASYNDIYRLFYHIALFKYSRMEHLKKTHSTAFKIATGPKLSKLVSMEFINGDNGIYTANKTTIDILNIVKINKRKIDTTLLPSLPVGYGSINELNNTDVFVDAIGLKDYHALLYPDFTYLRPDALLILKRENKYRLVFIEVESGKSGWDNWLNEKRYNYLKLSGDKRVYDYWTKTAHRLGLKAPETENFKFTVNIVGKTEKNWGDGFIFSESIWQ